MFLFGFLSLILGLIHVQLQFLVPLDYFGSTIAYTLKFLMILVGLAIMYRMLPKTTYL